MIRRRAGRAHGAGGPGAIQRALRRPRWRVATGWLAGHWVSIIGASGAFGLCLLLLTSSRFRVQQVAVRRQSASAEAAITRATQLSQVVGHNIFLVNTNRVAREVAAVPSVRSARVVPHFPNAVEIEIVERTPVAVWRTAAGAFLVDDQGFVVAEATEETAASLFAINDTTGQELHLGDAVSQRTLLTAMQMAGAMTAAGRAATGPAVALQEVQLAPEGLVFVTDAGWRVIVGDGAALNQKLANFAAFLGLAQERSLKVQTLDLRPLDRPYYQVEGTPLPTPRAAPAPAAPAAPTAPAPPARTPAAPAPANRPLAPARSNPAPR